MLNGACKYRERRDTKGAPKRSGVWGRQAEKGEGGRGRCTRSVHRVPGQKDSARGVPSRKRRTGKGSGGSNTKGCFNSLLSSVAKQEEEKVTPPVRNYLANLWRMRARVARRSRTRGEREEGGGGVG